VKQLSFWHESQIARRKVVAPFEIDCSVATAPGYERVFWRLLSFRNPYRRWNPEPWHFEGVLLDRKTAKDILLVRDPKTDCLVEVE
jgi:hypothetical protein